MMQLTTSDLLDAGVHFGHLSKKWHPNMAPFIFMKQKGIHIIDLYKTQCYLQEAAQRLHHIARSGRKILFVATKRQAKESVEDQAKQLQMPYMTEKWLGGTLTNFVTIRKLLKKIESMDRMLKDHPSITKKEQMMMMRKKERVSRILQGIADMTRLPAALFVVDINREMIAVKEAQKLNIPIFALIDTNANPNLVDYPIPGNDDAVRSIALIVQTLGSAIRAGIAAYREEKAENTARKAAMAKEKAANSLAEKDTSTAAMSTTTARPTADAAPVIACAQPVEENADTPLV